MCSNSTSNDQNNEGGDADSAPRDASTNRVPGELHHGRVSRGTQQQRQLRRPTGEDGYTPVPVPRQQSTQRTLYSERRRSSSADSRARGTQLQFGSVGDELYRPMVPPISASGGFAHDSPAAMLAQSLGQSLAQSLENSVGSQSLENSVGSLNPHALFHYPPPPTPQIQPVQTPAGGYPNQQEHSNSMLPASASAAGAMAQTMGLTVQNLVEAQGVTSVSLFDKLVLNEREENEKQRAHEKEMLKLHLQHGRVPPGTSAQRSNTFEGNFGHSTANSVTMEQLLERVVTLERQLREVVAERDNLLRMLEHQSQRDLQRAETELRRATTAAERVAAFTARANHANDDAAEDAADDQDGEDQH